MSKQLEERFLDIRPSEARLVQLHMCKHASTKCLPAEWVETEKTFYLTWLRRAAAATGIGAHTSPFLAAGKTKSRNAYLYLMALY